MIRINDSKSLKAAVLVSVFLLFAAAMGFGQQQVNLTAGPDTITLPDGTTVPMWGYTCGPLTTGVTSTANCAPLSGSTSLAATGGLGGIYVVNGGSGYTTAPTVTVSAPTGITGVTSATATAVAAVDGGQVVSVTLTSHGAGYTAPPTITIAGTGTGAVLAGGPAWSPVVITVPITAVGGLQINLTNNLSFFTGGAANNIPTSIVIVGQVGGGLGSSHTTTPSPNHSLAQGCPTWFIATPGVPGAPCTAAQTASGTPPAQGPRVQSMSTEVPAVAVGTVGATSTSLTWTNLKPGTYLLESGTHPSIQVPMGLIGMLVVTNAPTGTGTTTAAAGTAYPAIAQGHAAAQVAIPAVTYNADVPLEFSEIDPVQNKAVQKAVFTAGFSETAVWSKMNTGTVTALTVTPGSGYTSAPIVSFTGGCATTTPPTCGGAAATATLGFPITGLSLTNGGSGYTAPPIVSFGGTGEGGAATAVLGPFGVSSIAVTAGGTGYASPTVTVAPPGCTINTTTCIQATATATVTTGTITAITVTAAGAGYTSAPTVTITDTSATATGAAAAATITASVASLTLVSGGAYPSTPSVQFSGGGGTGAAATATVSTTSTLTVTLTSGGGGYTTAPLVSLSGGGGGTGAAVTAIIGGSGCGTANTCYPPAVNYTPFYYLINGQAFDKTNPGRSLFAATSGTATCATGTCPVTTGISGTVLVRLVNAGLRMHVPAILGSQTVGFTGAGVLTTGTILPVNGFTLIAEDGNPVPDASTTTTTTGTTTNLAPRVKTEVFMASGKTYDVMVNAPLATTGAPAPLPIYARDLALSANSSVRDAGMLAYISVNGAQIPGGLNTSGNPSLGIFASAAANPDTYSSVVPCATTATTCIPLVISDVAKGVIANDVNVYGVELSSPAPVNGTVTCNAQFQNPTPGICANGTFTYTPTAGMNAGAAAGAQFDQFGYCANGGSPCTTVTLNVSSLSGAPTAVNQSYASKMATFIKISSPGLLLGNTDPNNLPLSVVVSSVTLPACTNPVTVTCGSVDAQGGFTLAIPTPTTPPTSAASAGFTYVVQNSQGRPSAAGTVTVTFPVPSNLKVNVLDAQAYNNCNGNTTCISALAPFSDYRWIIEEDRTFWVDPNCTTNNSITTPGCPGVVTNGTIPTFGVNFHTSSMPYVAQGCTGPLSCEGGQTMLDTRPACTTPGVPAGCSTTAGTHIFAICDLGNGACRPDPNQTTGSGSVYVNPSEVVLDPAKRYYISVLPGDAANPFPTNANPAACNGVEAAAGNTACGHTMSGAPVPPACNVLATTGTTVCTTASAFQPVNVLVLPTPLPTGKLSVIVFEDDFPLNGEQDGGGGNGTVAPIEPGLGGFNLVLWDTFGGLGDVTGQNTYDMFNQPLGNGLAGMIDPMTGLDACPLTPNPLQASGNAGSGGLVTGNGAGTVANADPTTGMTGMIVTCPKYEADGTTLSPVAGQAVVYNLMPEKFSVQAYPGADRIARGEEWLQTNTLDGQHPHDSFIRIGEPSYFQEYGPAGYHVSIGFANPAIINARHNDVCNGNGTPGSVGPCTNTINGQVDVERISRTPDQRLYPSGSRDALAWTQCWVSLGDPDGEDFMFTKCDANGNFSFANVPGGNWRLTVGDQWNDQIIDGLSTGVNVGCTSAAPNGTNNATTCPGGQTLNITPPIGAQQWQSNLYTRTYVDDNKNGIWDPGEIGIPLIYTRIYYRDGHNSNGLNTDFNGIANFNETYPLFNWYVVEADATRYKTTGVHTVYDAGGPADGSPSCTSGARSCGTSTAYHFMTNTREDVPLPADLSVPGAVYCAQADCALEATTFASGTPKPSTGTAGLSTGRIDPPFFFGGMEGWAGLTGLSNWIDFGKAPFAGCPPACATVTLPGSTTSSQVGENGGIIGQITYASTRPFDDASQMILQPWEPLVPGVTLNLYQEGFATDGTPTLTLVDTTQSTSWDDWSQGFYDGSAVSSAGGGGLLPYMNCPGQGTGATGAVNQDLFFFTLDNQPNFLNYYNAIHSTPATMPPALPYSSQYKCYDSMHQGNQIQPAPYDGHYSFPSFLGVNAATNGTAIAGHLNTSIRGGVGVPVWDPTISYTAGTIVMYQSGTSFAAYSAVVANTGVTPGTNAAVWTSTATPSSWVAATMGGTNCTICVANPDSSDHWRVGNPMLPPGKYVVQVIMPPGYEVYKEEDKNLLIGDNFIAPVTQQFGGLGANIFILPDQASVASMYDPSAAGYNPNNFQDETTSLGLNDELSGVPGYPGFQDHLWPCVGEQRVVPDYLSLFPLAHEVAPFAGATRPLCDRKEVVVENQASVRMHFAIFTSTHIASKYTGAITDDLTSEFDPFSPQFGEKFSPPNMPVSTKDYLGNEISRVYSDHWGAYDGLTFSSWEVNPPNITGYSPTIMVQCINDPGPITDTNPASPTYGQMITDPLYNAAYSDFCYEQPYMPGLTNYQDTPVVPTQAFVGAAYNSPDCAYPDTTPAIKEVDGDGIGPWVSRSGVTLTITALGDQQVNNAAYSGPSATTAPFSMKTVTRHYGFGTQCLSPTAGSTTCSTLSSVTIGGRSATIDSWSDTAIQVTVPSGVPECAIQQQAEYAGSEAQCGQLLITAGNGKQSIDAVTVTIGGKAPVHVTANQTVQGAIDQAAPGDLIMIDPTCMTVATSTSPSTAATCSTAALHAATPTQTASAGSHNEMLLMWKPVRLQGVGAVSSIINASAFPAGKLLDPWRRHLNCLFGLTLQGVPQGAAIPVPGSNPPATTPASYDPSGTYSCPDAGWQHFNGGVNTPQIDRLPLEATIGWDATQNGNLAEQFQEPSLMGAYEGSGITVLAKGVDFHGGNPWTDGNEGGAFPTGTTLLTGVGPDPLALPVGDNNPLCHTSTTVTTNPFPSNFTCNPSSIDGLGVTSSSQGGGGIFVHGWAHHLQIANNRVYNNAGTLTGGISVGQGEFAGPYVVGGTTNAPPGSCGDGTGLVTNQHMPDCFQILVNVHNNNITNNSSLGDELFSGTLSGGGGVTFCTGNDYYKFNYNWVCGNLSAGEGGGLVHLGEIQNGDIEHNSFVLNQSTNPTIPTNGGGIQIMGTPDTDPTCGTTIDADCPPGLSDGTGRNLTINANLIQANMAESGSGGGIRLNQVNGSDVSLFPSQPTLWNNVSITNNMIVNNLAGWDGAGISLQDSLNVAIVNNTISSNDTLASSGVLTQSVGTPDASAPAGSCVQAGLTTSCPQSAGVTSTPNSGILTTTFTGLTITCPNGQSGCTGFSNPLLENNVIWQNRSFYIGIGNLGAGTLNQQKLISLFDAFGTTAAPQQTASGQCGAGTSYWDIGVRGDTGPGNHSSGFTLSPAYSVLDDSGYASTNLGINPNEVSQYCNGSRVPPECTPAMGCGGPSGYGVPPGIVDASAPNPVFSLTPSATVDEGNNWINVSWGPLSLSNDAVTTGSTTGNYGGGPLFGNYALNAGSPAIDYVPLSSTTLPTGTIPQLSTDFYGNPRPDAANPNHFDVGAVEFQNGSGVGTLASITPNSGAQGTVVNVTITGTGLTLATAVNVSGSGIAVSNFAAVSATTVTATFTIAPTATLTARNVTVTTPAGTSNAVTFTVIPPPGPALTSIAPSSQMRGTSTGVTLTGTNFVTGASVVATPAVAGFTISNVIVVNPTTITATFSSILSTALGNVNIDVVTAGGASNTLPFAISGPVLTSISPVSQNRGTTGQALTLTGSGLTGATSVNFPGSSGVIVTGFTVVNDTTINATVNIPAFATAGATNVTVTTAAGISNAVTFTVTVPPAGLFSIAPTTGARGTTQAVTLTGISFVTGTNPATGIAITGGGITVGGFTVVNDTTITANFTIAPTAALTARNVTVTTTGAPTTPVTFTVVNPGTPVLNSITPASGLRRIPGTPNPVPVVLAGTNFTAGSTVNIVAPANGLSVVPGSVVVVNPTQINATLTTTSAAVIGPRSITVTTPGGTSGTVTYTVLGPVLASIVPTSALRGQGAAIPVDLFGSGLTGTTAVTIGGGGGGVTVGPITVVSDTDVQTTLTISAFAAGGGRNVTVTAPGGVSNAVVFTVTVPPTPTLTSISPATGVRGTTVPVTLTGTNFISGETTVAVSGFGVTPSTVNVTSSTTATATLTISTFASLTTPYSVTVNVAGAAAASNAVPFTVQGATLTAIAPNTGARGTTVPVTFTGANLTGATGVNGLGGSGVSVATGSFTVVNSTTVTANLVISGGATLGILNLGLATPIGNTNTIPFTVQNPPAATLASALNNATGTASATRPAAGSPPLAVTVTLTGTNFTPAGTTVNGFTGVGGITTTVTSSTSITVSFNLSSGATAGARSITVTTPAGTTTPAVTFTIN